MEQYNGYDFDWDKDGNEVLVRMVSVDEYTLRKEFVISASEFVACYKRWIVEPDKGE